MTRLDFLKATIAHYPHLCKVAKRYGAKSAGKQTEKDMVNKTILRLLARRGYIGYPVKRVKLWLNRCVINSVMMMHKRDRVEAKLFASLDSVEAKNAQHFPHGRLDLRIEVARSLKGLDRIDKLIVEHVYKGPETLGQLAKTIGIPESTLRKKSMLLSRLLRERLGHYKVGKLKGKSGGTD